MNLFEKKTLFNNKVFKLWLFVWDTF
jgi:hypothetical protein